MHAKLQNCAEWFLNFFYSVSLCLFQCILIITTFTLMESSSLPAYIKAVVHATAATVLAVPLFIQFIHA